MWNVNDPKPFDDVDKCEPEERPRVCRLGGVGRSSCGGSGRGVSFGDTLGLNDCCPNGETGGERMGRFEIGEGGTIGNPSRIEYALVEVDITEDASETLLWTPRPCAFACA